jgi:L-asparaginase / beta-aspartyl-peptidase
MRYFTLLLLFCLSLGCINQQNKSATPPPDARPAYALAIHGGAGALSRADMTPEKEARYRAALDSALTIGESILKNGGTSLDAVTATVAWLEDCPLFNAGRGAVFTHEGKNELDASIMDGSNQKAGAVGGVMTIKNPIRLARAVMEKSPHVLLVGRGAEQFAQEQGIEVVDPKWFYTQPRWDYLQEVLEAEKKTEQEKAKTGSIYDQNRFKQAKFGTVGCVALDQQGHLAAATSTGGMTNKRWNRIGDAPLIGAGTYADDAVCAVSCTGHGEYFIRYAVAHDVWAMMAYRGDDLATATDQVVMKKLVEKGGEGGLIAVDKSGHIATPFNSEGMYRGWAKPGAREVAIYK